MAPSLRKMLCSAHIVILNVCGYNDYNNFPNVSKGSFRVKKDRMTDDLQMELMSATDLNKFIEKNEDKFCNVNIADLLNEMYIKRDISKAALAKKACISEVYLHQMFAGTRNPSRNRLLCLCFGLDATMEETQAILKHCGYGQLYSRKKRDAIIIYGLLHEMELPEVNERLLAEGEERLY